MVRKLFTGDFSHQPRAFRKGKNSGERGEKDEAHLFELCTHVPPSTILVAVLICPPGPMDPLRLPAPPPPPIPFGPPPSP